MSDGLDPAAIAEGIKAQLDATLTGVNVYAFPPGDPQYPAIGIVPDTDFIAYQRTFGTRGLCELRFRLEIVVAVIETEDAYLWMYALLGTNTGTSIFDILAADPTFGGTVGDAKALTVSGPTLTPTDDGRLLLSAVFPLVVHEPQRGA